ncbi:MAG: DUF3800 domain-containing protein [Planctomycetaceae bacterium]|nr:DUF3800 domain-containing protein [Planctomycetaceae bacterium]
MYLDESGNHQMDAKGIANNRYLGVVGTIVDMTHHYPAVLCPAMESLKRAFFGNDPDDRVILHREDIVGRRNVFSRLSNPDEALRFNKALCQFVAASDVGVIAVVIDKQGHYARYGLGAMHPYHYCAKVLMERYFFWLRHRRAAGDAMAESRGARENEALQAAWRGFYSNGTGHISGERLARLISTDEIKIRTKDANIHGLQLADIIATAATDNVLMCHFEKNQFRHPLDRFIHDGVASKYHCNPASGMKKGYGQVFLSGMPELVGANKKDSC